MAKLIGGIAHGRIIDNLETKYFLIPVFPNNRQPKQEAKTMFTSAKYERTDVIIDGEVVYRFIEGYYEPIEHPSY